MFVVRAGVLLDHLRAQLPALADGVHDIGAAGMFMPGGAAIHEADLETAARTQSAGAVEAAVRRIRPN